MKQMHFPWKIQEYIQRGGYNQKVTLKIYEIYLPKQKERRKKGREKGKKEERKTGRLSVSRKLFLMTSQHLDACLSNRMLHHIRHIL